jgi:murein DD-endopeptidase
VAHRLEFDLVRATGREHLTMQGGRASPRRDPGFVLGLPVRAGRWVAVYGPSADRGHRRFLYTVDGRARIPARFAIDWLKLGDDDAFSHGDPAQLTSWYGYGAEVLAVADATVADARDDIAADTPVSSAAPAPIALENASGNYVSLDLGGGRYAFYEHLKPGTIRVVPGARVRRGDVIGRLGNTGSSSAGPHLHFHISDANASLGAEGMPYGFDRFESLGEFQFPDAGTGAAARISPRRRASVPPAVASYLRPTPCSSCDGGRGWRTRSQFRLGFHVRR